MHYYYFALHSLYIFITLLYSILCSIRVVINPAFSVVTLGFTLRRGYAKKDMDMLPRDVDMLKNVDMLKKDVDMLNKPIWLISRNLNTIA